MGKIIRGSSPQQQVMQDASQSRTVAWKLGGEGSQRQQQHANTGLPNSWKLYQNKCFSTSIAPEHAADYKLIAQYFDQNSAAPQKIDDEAQNPGVSSLPSPPSKRHDSDVSEREDDDGMSASIRVALQREVCARYGTLGVLTIAEGRPARRILSKAAGDGDVLHSRFQKQIKAAVLPINEELEKEKEARAKLESEKRRLSLYLADANKAVEAAARDIDRKRKSRRQMEALCDELTQEIGQGKGTVEALKREHADAKRELEEERAMLELSGSWREERLQMKLLEARLEIEKRSMAVQNLKNELVNRFNTWKLEG